MNVLPLPQQIQVIAALVEGCSIRATERMTGIHRDTIMRLGARIGEGCARLHDERVRGLNVALLEADEIWSFVGKKQRKLTADDSAEKGDTYTFIGIDASKKAIVAYTTGKRDGTSAASFALDLRDRILNRPQLTTDGFGPYVDAIERAFGADIDFAQLIKEYEETFPGQKDAAHRYSPGRVKSSETRVIQGNPSPAGISTSLIERQNLTVRMQVRRFTRLTNAYSKKLSNHEAAVSLYVGWYNWCRVHESLKVTPAMEMRLTDHVWTIEELIAAALETEDREPSPAPVTPVPPPSKPVEPKGFSAGQMNRMKNGKGSSTPYTPFVGQETRVPWLRVVEGGKAA